MRYMPARNRARRKLFKRARKPLVDPPASRLHAMGRGARSRDQLFPGELPRLGANTKGLGGRVAGHAVRDYANEMQMKDDRN